MVKHDVMLFEVTPAWNCTKATTSTSLLQSCMKFPSGNRILIFQVRIIVFAQYYFHFGFISANPQWGSGK